MHSHYITHLHHIHHHLLCPNSKSHHLQLTPNPCLLSHLCLLLLCSANSIQNPKTNPSRNYLMDSSHHNHRQFLNLTLSATKQVKPNLQINFIKSIQHQPIPILLHCPCKSCPLPPGPCLPSSHRCPAFEPVLDSTLPRPWLASSHRRR